MSIPLGQKEYQPFGDLFLETNHDAAENYRRELCLDTAVARVSYKADGAAFERQVFSSTPDQVLVIRIAADKPGKVSFTAKLTSPHKSAAVSANLSSPGEGERMGFGGQVGRLAMAGKVQDDGLAFEAGLLLVPQGGKVTIADGAAVVENADNVLLLLCAATSFKSYQDISADPAARCEAVMTAIVAQFAKLRDTGKTFDTLLRVHVEEHQKSFRRVSLDVGTTDAANKPTNERLKTVAKEPDPALATLFFQYGRYLLIGCSRPGCQPANLQGLWNDEINPPWGSKYTVNINTEMNYWPAEVTNLSECTGPLFDMIADCVVTGRKTAQAHYGAKGWVLHHNTDLWRGTAPINHSNHGIWVVGGAWLCHHLWEHYQFTGDKEFLSKRGYPAMKEAAEFFTEFLIKDPKTGWLISGPSNSPEQGGLVMGPTMDHQIIRDLFGNTIAAANVLGVDKEFAAKLEEMRKQIAPNQIGKLGQLQEWMEDKDDPKNQHRHVSHLWGLYPGWDITARGTPKEFAAVKQSLLFRGDGGTGWSKAWKINLWARLLDGDHANKMLIEALAGNTYPNLFDAHPPFQIDGNFGATSGIAEMLLQSHMGDVHLLPALPKAWATGSVKGLCARGGFDVDISWKDGALTAATIRSKLGGVCQLRYGEKVVEIKTEAGKSYALNAQLAIGD
jgi:alpha-L-fucosidase 2